MERFDQTGKQRCNVRMHQFQQAHPNKEQQHAFHELEHRNRGQADLVRRVVMGWKDYHTRSRCAGRLGC